MKAVVVGLSGPSCVGKSTVANALAGQLSGTLIPQDLYFRDAGECPPDANFCDLRYLHVAEFVDAVRGLANGCSVEVPQIDFSTFTLTGIERLDPSPILIVEGMTIFRIPAIAELCDHSFYLTLPFEELTARKLVRDARERHKPPEIIDCQLTWMRAEYDHDLATLNNSSVELLDARDHRLVDRLVDTLNRRAVHLT